MADRVRQRLTVGGLVQGVGFRPFVYTLARRHGLAGSVVNTAQGVVVEIEGPAAALADFGVRLRSEAPPLARIDAVASEMLTVRGGTEFVIRESQGGPGRTLVSPDVATCADCLAELADPADRRYRHPFISCTNCGPRFTVITALPYDRPATTMDPLPLCAACAAEYADPADRRFHAQTVACPDCGPTLTLWWSGESSSTGSGHMPIEAARRLLADGAIVAIKGLGGYHLACDASNADTVTTLRKRKDRGDKPFAVMAADLATAESLVQLTGPERDLLTDPRRPVVLLPRRDSAALAPDVAPDSPDLGVMLPYTGVHRLLFGLPGDPPGPQVLVLTSGNLAGEPIVTDDVQARERLAGLADAWLSHDRRIHVPCDDSVVRLLPTPHSSGREIRELPVRRSRGYAPLPIALPVDVPPALAVGSDLKNTFGVAEGRYAWLSGHIGDMDDLATLSAFGTAVEHLSTLTGVAPELVVADRHPGFRSTGWARQHRGDRPLVLVQHHHAHLGSVMAENGHPLGEPIIGFAFDGTGYGDDGAVWGGEFLVADYVGFRRAGHLAYAPLPGGDAGVRNPCRMALSLLRQAGIDWDAGLPPVAACSPTERSVLARQLETGLNCVPTSSMGRLFDAVSSLAGVCHRVAYEAEAAMRFEGLARRVDSSTGSRRIGAYAFALDDDLVADPAPALRQAAADVLAGVPAATIAGRFHHAVADLVVAVALRLRADTMINTVGLSGGVFLNVLLTQACVRGLAQEGFAVLRHRQVPPSDAGLALGQLVIGATMHGERGG